MKFVTLFLIGVTLYVISDAERVLDHQQRRAKQMPYFHYMPIVPFYAPFYSLPYYGLAEYGAMQRQPAHGQQEQLYFRSNVHQQADRRDVIANRFSPHQRLFFGSNIGYTVPSVNNNYLFKTSFVFSTATGTVCKMISCIPLASFAANQQNVICRRKRYLEESSADESDDVVMPTQVLQSVTEMALLDRESVDKSPVLESSLDEGPSEPSLAIRTKRFAFALTTTITTYELVTTSYTVTIDPGQNLVCRPSNIALC